MESIIDQTQVFERYPKLREEMRSKGDVAAVTFESEERVVSEEVVRAALERKGYSNIKAAKSIVIVASDAEGNKKEIWHKVTDFTALRQLKTIKDANGGKLQGAEVRVTRIAANSPNESNWKYELVQE